MYAPSVLLLLWCGLAASIGAAIAGTLIGGTSRTPWTLAPRPRSFPHALAWSLIAGILAYPIAYGVAFEALHRADLRTGILLGALHGALMFISADPRTNRRAAVRVAVAHLVYGASLAFFYVTP